MKKVLLVAGVAALALASIAGAYAFNANLTVGSTGADVSALQSALIAAGYSIPSIASGAAQPGYFGSQTKAAVVAYQTAKGLPSTGFVGPLTRGILNGGAATVSMTPAASTGCPAGYTCTANVGTTPAPVAGTNGTITTPNVAGTLAFSLWTTPSGVTAYKGQSYDLAGYKIQAGASDMAVTSLTFDFDSRFWLYASGVTVKDETGKVIGTVSGLNASNFTELTVGSDYRISVPVSGLVVKSTQSKYLTLNATFLPVPQITSPSNSLNIIQAQVRSVDGTGVTDTETVNSSNAGVRSFTYQGTSVGQITATIDPSSPTTGLVQVSTAAQTQNVVLGIYDLKSANQPGTLQNLAIAINGTTTVPFANVQIQVAGLTYSASTLTNNLAVFTNLSVPLAADTYVPVKIVATVVQDTNSFLDGTTITTTASSTGLSVIDSSYNAITVNSFSFSSAAQTFTSSGVTVSGLTTVLGGVSNSAQAGASSTQQVTFTYSLTAGNNPIYISSAYASAIGYVVTGQVGTSTQGLAGLVSNVSIRDNDSTNDAAGYFYIAPGQTKTITIVNAIAGKPGSVTGTYSINKLYYGTGWNGSNVTGVAALSASAIANTLYGSISF